MIYSQQFKDDALLEMSKRLGYKTVSACAAKIGSKEFARQREKFYKIYHKELIKTGEQKKYYSKRKNTNKQVDINLDAVFEFLKETKETNLRDLAKKFNFSSSYLSIILKLGYISLNRKGRKYFYTENKKGKTTDQIMLEVRMYSANVQRVVRQRESLNILEGK